MSLATGQQQRGRLIGAKREWRQHAVKRMREEQREAPSQIHTSQYDFYSIILVPYYFSHVIINMPIGSMRARQQCRQATQSNPAVETDAR